jgi:hypothetical protein
LVQIATVFVEILNMALPPQTEKCYIIAKRTPTNTKTTTTQQTNKTNNNK